MSRNESTRELVGTGIIAMLLLFAAAFTLEGKTALPDRYSLDEQKIQAVARGLRDVGTDQSFNAVADIYRILGLADAPELAGLLGLCIYAFALFVAAPPRSLRNVGPLEWVLVAGSVVLAAVYLGNFSKDVWVIPVALVFMLIRPRGFWAESLVLAPVILYAATMRSYWFLVGATYLVVRLVIRSSRSWVWVGLSSALLLWGFAFLFPIVLGVDVDAYRTASNELSFRRDVGSLIRGIVPSGGALAGALNATYIAANFVIPVDLALRGSALYILVSAYLATFWVTIVRVTAAPMRNHTLMPSSQRALSLLIALTLVQSVFEPDYGSYVRHLAPALLLGIYVIVRERANSRLNVDDVPLPPTTPVRKTHA